MNKEEQLFQKRLIELAELADRRGIVTFTDFLNLNELNILHGTSKELSFVKYKAFGGFESAERQIIAFIPDALSYDYTFPIACLRIRPLHEKFSDRLTHRDYLGAVLNLGIERSTTGDILIDDGGAWMFCLERMSEFLCNELVRVKNTSVQCNVTENNQMDYTPKYEVLRGSLASVRLDSVLSLAFRLSRSSLIGVIEGGKVFVNGRLTTSNGYRLKEGDLVSVRGLGRFRYLGVTAETRKGRLMAELQKYI